MTFDASADGYARGEGVGIVVLKRLRDAVDAGDTILAVVRGTAVNHDGRSSGMTVPNPAAQQAVIDAALHRARIAPADVSYVEAHGTGTSLGDPIELNTLEAAIGRHHSKDEPLLVGSVKTNIGHLESAAGVAGLLKLILALRHEEIPPHLHLNEPNPNVDWDRLHIEITTKSHPWPADGRPRIGSISSFGASGTNSHAVLGEPPARPAATGTRRPWQVLTLSARDDVALGTLARRYAADLADRPDHELGDICYTTHVGRTRMPSGLAVAGSSVAEIVTGLSAYTEGGRPDNVLTTSLAPHRQRKVAWLFTGQGAQYPGMGRELLAEPAYRAAFDQVSALMTPLLGRDLTELLGADDAELDQTGYTQPALFAVEYALAMMWLSWGGKPAAVLGHSLGEIVAACVAGVLDLPDAVRLVVERGRLMQALPAGGAMATLVCDEARAAAAIAGHPGRVAIAAVNGPADTVIAGPAVDLATITDALAADGVKTRLLRVSHAFHSPLMAPALDGLRAVAAGITHRPARLPLISNVTGRFWADEDRVDPDYWVRHAISPVRFADGIRTLHAAGYRTFLEIGPQPVLLGLGSRGLDDPACEWIPSLRRGHADQQRIMAALGALHLRGIAVDWPAFHRAEQVRRTPLPTYAWRGEPYWFRVPDQPRAIAAETGEPVAGVGRRVRGALPTYEIEPPDQPWRTAELTRIALLAAADGIGGGWHGVRTVTAGAPIPPDPDRVLRLVLTPDDDLGTTTFAYHSATPAEEATGAPWRRHQSGMLTRRPVSADEPADPITIEAPTGESWQDPAELLMRMRWDPVPATAPVDLAGRGFLLLSNGNPLAEELSAELRRRGGTCVIAPSTDAAGDADHVVLLDGLDTPSSTADAADVLAYRDRADLRTVAVLQEILDRPARLCLLTRGAVDTGADQAGQDPFGGTLWGIGRVLALEHPEHWGGAIDLDPDAGTDVALLADALATVADEDQQALRGRSRLVARVVHSGLSAAELRAEVAVRPDGAYLITGAFGGIGRAVARWLAARGAGKLIMAGRTALPDRATWDDPALPDSVLTRVRAVRELERLGAEVDVVAIDVADADAVRALVATSTAGHRPLRGVLHAAGVSLPQFARDVRVAEYDQVWRPKVLGGWALHRATLDCELDFFLSFSSVAATWGSQHLTSYAAANGFLDALAAHRRSVGRPALTVAWSSWELESSLFDADVVEFITATGMRLLSAPQCLRLAGALLAGDETHHIVCAADWAKYKSIMEARAERPVFRAITVAADESGDADPAALTGQLLATPSGQRRAVVDGYLRAQLAQILRLDAGALTGEFHLLEMGLDSLMVMELIGRVRKDLAIDMKSPDFFACDANEWADFLLRLVETQHEALVA